MRLLTKIKLQENWGKWRAYNKERDGMRFTVPDPKTEDLDPYVNVTFVRDVDDKMVENKLGLCIIRSVTP